MNIVAIMAGSMEGDRESGRIGEAVRSRGGALLWFYRLKDDELPLSIEGYDALIVFGGEVSVHDPALKPYFDDLAQLIHRFHEAGKPILGSCLGCQSIAYAFGAKVRPQGFLEYGFTPLSLTDAGREDPLLKEMPAQPVLFEMHSDTFELPADATLLMSGDQVTHQAFRIGDNVYGFQCHFEVTPEIVDTWTRRELIDNPARDQQEIAGLVEKVAVDFEQYQQAQTEFALSVMNAWLDRV